jgi:protein pelota
MILLFKDLKKGEVRLKTTSLDDLWHLAQIISEGDLISGKSLRKIKISEDSFTRKTIFIEIKVEKIEYCKNNLKLLGRITRAPTDVPLNSYHSFNITDDTEITIIKHWLKYQIDLLRKSTEETPKILLIIFDREEAFFAMLKSFGYELLTEIKGNVQKKDFNNEIKGDFFAEIIKQIKEYDLRYGLEKIIIGSPAFWKDELMKKTKIDEFKNKIILATISNVNRKGFDELIKRKELKTALKEVQYKEEVEAVEELLKRISKNEAVAYGLAETENAAKAGAVETLLITQELLISLRKDNQNIDVLLKTVEQSRGNIKIISSEHEGGKKLDGLGGIGALLRFKI